MASSNTEEDECDCMCDGKVVVEVVYGLGVATGLFLVSTIISSVLVILLIRRARQRVLEEQAKDPPECRHWAHSPVPSLQETLSSQTMINTLGLDTTETFHQRKKTSSTHVIKPEPRTPKRSAPPPPNSKGKSKHSRSGELRRASPEQEVLEDYSLPHHRYVSPPAAASSADQSQQSAHCYMELDLNKLDPEAPYSGLTMSSFVSKNDN